MTGTTLTLGGGQHAPLLEREAELDACRAAIADAAQGRGSLLMLDGSAGIGKSRMLVAARSLAAEQGLRSLFARGSELEREFPFGGVRQLFDGELLRPEVARSALAGAAAPAGPLLRGEYVEIADQHGFSLLHGLYWLTQNLAEGGPLLLVLDDLHWIDRQSLRFAAYLCQRVEELPIAVIGASRPPREQGPERALIASLAALPSTSLRRLRPLSEPAVSRMVELTFAEPEPEFVSACAGLTSGNPFLLGELLSELADEGIEPTASGARLVAGLAPEAVQRSLLARLARLPGAAAQLISAVATLGDDAHLRLAAALAGLDLDTASAAAASLADADLLREHDPLEFVHPLIRSMILADLPAATRASYHLEAARLLLDAGAEELRAAPHLIGARRGGEPWVVRTLIAAAARAVAQGAPESAVTYLRRALEEPPPPPERGPVLLALGKAEAAAGEPEAAERLERAVEQLADPSERASALLALGRHRYACGENRAAAAAFERGLAHAGDGEDPLSLELRASYALAAMWVAELREGAFERVAPLLRRADAGRTHAERVALANLSGDAAMKGADRDGAVALARRGWSDGALLREGTAEEPSIYAVSGVLQFAGHYAEGYAVLDAALADARERGSILAHATAAYCRGSYHWLTGDSMADAVADLELAIDARRNGWDVYLAPTYGFLSLALLELDRVEEAERRFAEAAELEDRWRDGTLVFPYFLAWHGAYLVRTGQPERALERLREAGALIAAGLRTDNPAVVSWRGPAALALARLGEREEALALASSDVALARAWGAPRAVGVALHSAGVVAGGEAGVALLREAIETLAGAGTPLPQAEALVDLGSALRRAGDRAGARDPLRLALDLASRSGAIRTARAAEQELVAAGARPRRRELSGPESLTPSESRVARLAAAGNSNREIAETLFVTLKAVEWHLGNAYRKLGIAGRRDLAALFAEEEPPGAAAA